MLLSSPCLLPLDLQGSGAEGHGAGVRPPLPTVRVQWREVGGRETGGRALQGEAGGHTMDTQCPPHTKQGIKLTRCSEGTRGEEELEQLELQFPEAFQVGRRLQAWRCAAARVELIYSLLPSLARLQNRLKPSGCPGALRALADLHAARPPNAAGPPQATRMAGVLLAA